MHFCINAVWCVFKLQHTVRTANRVCCLWYLFKNSLRHYRLAHTHTGQQRDRFGGVRGFLCPSRSFLVGTLAQTHRRATQQRHSQSASTQDRRTHQTCLVSVRLLACLCALSACCCCRRRLHAPSTQTPFAQLIMKSAIHHHCFCNGQRKDEKKNTPSDR